MAKLADLIWKNAELLRGAFKENEYRKVVLPFTTLRWAHRRAHRRRCWPVRHIK